MREHAVVGGCARRLESNDILVGQVEDLIRERVAVALDPFLQRRTWRAVQAPSLSARSKLGTSSSANVLQTTVISSV